MVHITNCRGLPILEHGPDNGTDALHFFNREPVSAREIARRTRWRNVSLCVRKSVVNPVQPAWTFGSSAVNAGLRYNVYDFVNGQIARVNALIGFAKKNRPPFHCFIVALHDGAALDFLFWRHVGPAFRPSVSTLFPLGMTSAALIGQAKSARCVTQKVFRSCWHFLFAAMANAVAVLGAVIFPHALNVGAAPPFFNIK